MASEESSLDETEGHLESTRWPLRITSVFEIMWQNPTSQVST